jgi:SAM-dependent methyltransferase
LAAESSVRACYSSWSQTYYDDYYGPAAAYPPVHVRILKRLLREARSKTLLDAGCGPASFLRLVPRALSVYGFDLTPEMVEEARRVLAPRRVPANHLWQGSVTSPRAYRAPADATDAPGRFDAAISIGVFPHIQAAADAVVVRNLRNAVRPGGLVVVEARNQLFSLFTMNRYTYQFLVEELIRAGDLRGRAGPSARRLDATLDKLKRQFRMDLPPVRRGRRGEPGYDEVVSRTHNPFAVQELFVRLGFSQVRILFYHYHRLPPMCEPDLPDLFRRASLDIEDPDDWRGHFMASAFLVAGTRR